MMLHVGCSSIKWGATCDVRGWQALAGGGLGCGSCSSCIPHLSLQHHVLWQCISASASHHNGLQVAQHRIACFSKKYQLNFFHFTPFGSLFQ